MDALVVVPEDAVYYACLGCVEIGRTEAADAGVYTGTERLRWWIDEGQLEEKARDGARGLAGSPEELASFRNSYGRARPSAERADCASAQRERRD